MTPEQLRQYDRQHVWHAFTQMAEYESRIITHAQGCWLYDDTGRRWFDGTSSLWCNVHGHRHPTIDAAVRAQLDSVAHVTSLGMSHPTTITLARRLVELTPPGLEHVFFSDSGASAVEVALKMAFQYWRQTDSPQPQRTKYLAFDQAYHGDTLGSVSVGGVARFHAMFEPLLFDVVRAPLPDRQRVPASWTEEQACAHYLESFAGLLTTHGDTLAAVILEPLVQCAAGMVLHPRGFLRGVRALTQQHGVLLIVDEVATGFGRTGTLFACEQENVTPDLLCLAKGLSGGYLPVAATLATNAIWQAFLGPYAASKTFFHGHTYGGNPLGCAAALGSLRVFEEEATLAQLKPKITQLQTFLHRLAQRDDIARPRQCGLLIACDLVDPATRAPYPWEAQRGIALCRRAWELGLALRPLGNVIYLLPPLAATAEELEEACVMLTASLNQLRESDGENCLTRPQNIAQ